MAFFVDHHNNWLENNQNQRNKSNVHNKLIIKYVAIRNSLNSALKVIWGNPSPVNGGVCVWPIWRLYTWSRRDSFTEAWLWTCFDWCLPPTPSLSIHECSNSNCLSTYLCGSWNWFSSVRKNATKSSSFSLSFRPPCQVGISSSSVIEWIVILTLNVGGLPSHHSVRVSVLEIPNFVSYSIRWAFHFRDSPHHKAHWLNCPSYTSPQSLWCDTHSAPRLFRLISVEKQFRMWSGKTNSISAQLKAIIIVFHSAIVL